MSNKSELIADLFELYNAGVYTTDELQAEIQKVNSGESVEHGESGAELLQEMANEPAREVGELQDEAPAVKKGRDPKNMTIHQQVGQAMGKAISINKIIQRGLIFEDHHIYERDKNSAHVKLSAVNFVNKEDHDLLTDLDRDAVSKTYTEVLRDDLSLQHLDLLYIDIDKLSPIQDINTNIPAPRDGWYFIEMEWISFKESNNYKQVENKWYYRGFGEISAELAKSIYSVGGFYSNANAVDQYFVDSFSHLHTVRMNLYEESCCRISMFEPCKAPDDKNNVAYDIPNKVLCVS